MWYKQGDEMSEADKVFFRKLNVQVTRLSQLLGMQIWLEVPCFDVSDIQMEPNEYKIRAICRALAVASWAE
jgi:hypothetical protein